MGFAPAEVVAAVALVVDGTGPTAEAVKAAIRLKFLRVTG